MYREFQMIKFQTPEDEWAFGVVKGKCETSVSSNVYLVKSLDARVFQVPAYQIREISFYERLSIHRSLNKTANEQRSQHA